MALTPEDVVNKRFNPTKFREGYDQDEVDDFLDEVVVELRRLNQENEELRQRLVASDARISELQRSASQAPPAAAAPMAAPVAAPPVAAPMPAPVSAPPAQPEFGAQDTSMDQSNTNNLLQLARRLHEEHVREGMEKRDQLIAEGHATAARIVSDAETEKRNRIQALEHEHAGLESRVEELRIFESSYREQLRGYIEGQLRELESAAPIAGANDAPAAPAPIGHDSAAPVYGSAAPEYAAPVYTAPDYAAPASGEFPAPTQNDYATPFGGNFSQPPAPQPADASAPPAYAAFPAPQADQQAQQSQQPQQPDYPAYSQRNNDNSGLGGN